MGKHINEIEYDDIQVVFLQRLQLRQEALGLSRRVNFMVRETVMPAVTVNLRLDERSFIEVLPFLFILINPQFGEHPRNLVRHQS